LRLVVWPLVFVPAEASENSFLIGTAFFYQLKGEFSAVWPSQARLALPDSFPASPAVMPRGVGAFLFWTCTGIPQE
jgi:hypothetical protein